VLQLHATVEGHSLDDLALALLDLAHCVRQGHTNGHDEKRGFYQFSITGQAEGGRSQP
jgi:hypothetical protein